MSWVNKRVTAWCAAVAASCYSFTAAASFADTFGLTSRSTAMGGAVAGRVADPSANYYNPSGLALSPSTQLSLGFVHVAPSYTIGGDDQQLASLDGWETGLLIPGELGGLPIAFGFASHATSDRLARVLTYKDSDQRWFVFDTRPQQVFIATNLAARPTSWLALGVGLSFLASTDGALQVTGVAEQPAGPITEHDSKLQHEVIAELVGVRNLLLGATVSAADDLDFGLTYRGQSAVTLGVDSTIDGAIKFGPIEVPVNYLLQSETVSTFVPQQLTLGAHYAPRSDLHLHLDLSWLDWSSMPSPLSATSSEITATQPQGLIVMLPELPPPRAASSAGLEDRIVPRLGAEWTSAEGSGPVSWALRGGYAFHPTPVVEQSSPNLADSDRHVFSAGAGVGLLDFGPEPRGALQFDVHVQWGLSQQRQLRDGEDQVVTVSGEFLAVGGTMGLRL